MSLKIRCVQASLSLMVVVVGGFIVAGCSSNNGQVPAPSSTTQPVVSSPATPDQQPPFNSPLPSGQFNNSLAKVASILGIDQKKLEDAFIQASAALGDGRPSVPRAGSNMPPPVSGTFMPVPSGTPCQPPAGAPGTSKELLAKVASILGIDQQKLEDAFNQVTSQ